MKNATATLHTDDTQTGRYTTASVFDLPIPENARLDISVHRLDREQFNELVVGALTGTLPVEIKGVTGGTRWWVEIGWRGRTLVLWPPDDLPRHGSAFQQAIDRRLAALKFIEVSVPARSEARAFDEEQE